MELGPSEAGVVEALLRDHGALDRLARKMQVGPVRSSPSSLDRVNWLAERLCARHGHVVRLLGEPAVVELVNCKDVQRRWAQELDVPLAEGEIVALELDASGRPATMEPLRSAIERHCRAGHGALLRGCEGASGSATRIIASMAISWKPWNGPPRATR